MDLLGVLEPRRRAPRDALGRPGRARRALPEDARLVAVVPAARSCLYQGEELGLPEAEIAFEELRDPYGIAFWPEFHGRDGCRTPMVWGSARPGGGGSAAASRPESVILGMTLTPLVDEMREELNAGSVAGGLVITMIDPVSDAAEMGLLVGDIITEVTQAPVATIAEMQARIDGAEAAGQESILLLIRRDGNPRFMALSIKDE